ncbi:hypothetical protein CEE37_09400 [candidate division LCP-89 bacterium B3_LCP]|uniref:Uncharacterized protein n=1 Tax=candidate division LCP-89 bacterium B3_LCP TaxID=2012998 RepID=A0A532UYF7_UNCL8|nr:MAG: hypothetical protein CEE37_09400 [candidate division LCP-89 bacterium B3_LCP]
MSNDNHNSWNDLLELSKIGDGEGQRQLFEKLAVTLRPILQCRLRGWAHEDQDDILQETLITVGQKLPQIESNPHKYSMIILRNKIGDALRARKRRIQVSIDSLTDPDSTSLKSAIEQALSQSSHEEEVLSGLDNRRQIDSIKEGIKRLSSFCQTFFLGILEDLDPQELWELFKSSEPGLQRNTYRKRIFDCRRKLKETLLECEGQ